MMLVASWCLIVILLRSYGCLKLAGKQHRLRKDYDRYFSSTIDDFNEKPTFLPTSWSNRQGLVLTPVSIGKVNV